MITPRATEKAYNAQTQHTYIFFVPRAASKQQIAAAIAEAYKVTVLDVRTANRKGKATRFSRGKHAYPGITYRQDHKVAYIIVKKGDKIPVFEDTKAEADKSEKSAKTTKAAKDQKAQKPAETATAKAAKAEKKVARSAKKSAKENQ